MDWRKLPNELVEYIKVKIPWLYENKLKIKPGFILIEVSYSLGGGVITEKNPKGDKTFTVGDKHKILIGNEDNFSKPGDIIYMPGIDIRPTIEEAVTAKGSLKREWKTIPNPNFVAPFFIGKYPNIENEDPYVVVIDQSRVMFLCGEK